MLSMIEYVVQILGQYFYQDNFKTLNLDSVNNIPFYISVFATSSVKFWEFNIPYTLFVKKKNFSFVYTWARHYGGCM